MTSNDHRAHANEQVTERLGAAGFDPTTITKFYAAADALARSSKVESEAFRLITLPALVGEAWSDTSNGNQVWAIARYGVLRTVMLRRSTQPATAVAFNVSRITVIA